MDLQAGPLELPGPTGESNVLHVMPRGTLLCLGPDEADMAAQQAMAERAGCRAETAAFDADHLVAG